ncbi:MAG: S8 family serine peptidase [Alphaproteobacteria bacterium]|nr:S8 family serine peptidase [Alphaproteobacteria bacterium]
MTIRLLACVAALATAGAVASAHAEEGRYVLVLKGNSAPADLAASVQAAGGVLVRTIPQVNIAIATSSNPAFAASAKAIGGVSDAGLVGASAVPDAGVPANPEASAPTAADDLFNAGLVWGVNRVHAPEAWANGHTGSHDTVVAVLDTGVAYNHPDLADNVVFNACVVSSGPCSPYPSLHWHGTHVAGTIAAEFGHGRVVGVAPNVAIANYNIFENIPGCGVCAYDDTRWVAMIDAAERGFKVESMSLGGLTFRGPGQDNADLNAYLRAEKRVAKYVDKLGTLMVVAAGNEGLNTNGTVVEVPGDIPEMVDVSATGIQPIPFYPAPNSFDIPAFYSNSGAAVNVSAPGGDCGEISSCSGNPVNGYPYYYFLVLSTYVVPSPACAATASCPVGYAWAAGTSMATPHASAVAALIYDANPGITPAQVKAKLEQSADNAGSRQEFGHGIVNADAATR